MNMPAMEIIKLISASVVVTIITSILFNKIINSLLQRKINRLYISKTEKNKVFLQFVSSDMFIHSIELQAIEKYDLIEETQRALEDQVKQTNIPRFESIEIILGPYILLNKDCAVIQDSKTACNKVPEKSQIESILTGIYYFLRKK